eukprot:141085-Pyramimonas_sp.AAC.1
MHEEALLGHVVSRFRSRGSTSSADPWELILSDPVDIEIYMRSQRTLQDHAKMDLARQLQLRDGLSVAQRYTPYGSSTKKAFAAA